LGELDITDETPLAATIEPDPAPVPPKLSDEYRRFWLLIGAGWLGTTLAYAIYDLPLKFVLKDDLKVTAAALSFFFTFGQFTNYIKPLAGIFTDAVPLFGTRRRHYLLLNLILCGLFWILIALVPRKYSTLLATYTVMHVTIVFISTTLGGMMTEGGQRFHASGRLSAQRLGITKLVGVVGGLLGGYLGARYFGVACGLVTGFHFLLVPLFYSQWKEPGTAVRNDQAWQEVKRQARTLYESRLLWAAAGLVCLVVAAPGFGTPLLYYQTDVLHFSTKFVGVLTAVSAVFAGIGAYVFSRVCGRVSLRPLLLAGILTHTLAALLYLGYRGHTSAIVITCVYEFAQTLALLPLYDLAMRATPRGSEALGYSVMMSAWNLTTRLSDNVGSYLFDAGKHWVASGNMAFVGLIVLNSATTALVLLAVPLLPRALTDRKDGEVGTH